jgi:hypothetical protein
MQDAIKIRRPWAVGLLALAARVESANLRDSESRGQPADLELRRRIVADYEGAIDELTRLTARDPSRLYVAGPMRGKPRYNAEAFDAAAKSLRASGYKPITPIQIDLQVDPAFDHGKHEATPEQIARFQLACILELPACFGVALLDGWQESDGTKRELRMAKALGLPCRSVEAWMENAAKSACARMHQQDSIHSSPRP